MTMNWQQNVFHGGGLINREWRTNGFEGHQDLRRNDRLDSWQQTGVTSAWVVLKQLPKPLFCATFSLVPTYNVYRHPITSLSSVNATY